MNKANAPRHTTTTLRITPPSDYLLTRDACSYGYFLLAPNAWMVDDAALVRTFDLGALACTARITQPRKARSRASLAGRPLTVRCDAALDRSAQQVLRAQITRMLRLDEGPEVVRAFHKADPRWKRSGRARLVRSASVFEDVIKTVTSCNVTWPSTVHMNRRLCEVLGTRSAAGGYAFPSARKLARTRPATLRGRCRVGYRDARIVQLAKLFARGEIDPEWLESPGTPDDEVYEALLALPGIGPYAAANIMQLLGRYERLPLDTESVRHARSVLGMQGAPPGIMKRLEEHYRPFGAHKFRSYWFELWDDYERRHGPAHTWDRETTGTQFTAAKLKRG